MASIKRLRELDFLRGLAIVLVLFRHKDLFKYTKNMGWIGVDLFFVLSGFLVATLLFKEYQKYGNIKPKLFLIRRGFKIYPLFYLALLPVSISTYLEGHFSRMSFLSEVLFFQNYYTGFGWALHGVSWSIAIEEHFYFGLAFILFLVINKWRKSILPTHQNWVSTFEKSLLGIMVLCFCLRLGTVLYGNYYPRDCTMTHLRIDSLLAGVLVSYLYNFRRDYFVNYFEKIRPFCIPLVLILLSFTPFVQLNNPFVKTIGFTFLYVAFALLLSYFVLTKNINEQLDKALSKYVVNSFSYIGVYSYSIYICHMFVNKLTMNYSTHNVYLDYIIYLSISILLGKFIYDYLEAFFLKIRDKYYPNRVA